MQQLKTESALRIEKRTFCGVEMSILLGHPEHDVLFFFKEAMLAAGIKAEGNISHYARKLDGKVFKLNEVINLKQESCLSLPKGAAAKAWLVTEAGLYETLNRGWAEQTKPFRDWVNGEVLPTIRKTGSYDITKSDTAEAKAFSEQNATVTALVAMVEALRLDMNALKQLVQEQTPTILKAIESKEDSVLAKRATAQVKDAFDERVKAGWMTARSVLGMVGYVSKNDPQFVVEFGGFLTRLAEHLKNPAAANPAGEKKANIYAPKVFSTFVDECTAYRKATPLFDGKKTSAVLAMIEHAQDVLTKRYMNTVKA